MTAQRQRAGQPHEPGEAAPAADPSAEPVLPSGFDPLHWEEAHAERDDRGSGGRTVLAALLVAAAFGWVAFAAWSAGRALAASGGLSAPEAAQWIAILAGPLALMGLVWLMFGRTRRRETERFTRSVVAMRTEARSLEALLEVLTGRIRDSHAQLQAMAGQLVGLGDETAGRLGAVARELDESSERVAVHGAALDRAAESARNDVAVLLGDLPRAEQDVRAMAEELRGAGTEATERVRAFGETLREVDEKARGAHDGVAATVDALVARLRELEQAGSQASARIGEAEHGLAETVDVLLARMSNTLAEIRSGVDAQAAAVAALVAQSEASLSRAGFEAAESLGDQVGRADSALDSLEAKIMARQESTRRLAAESAEALGALDQEFAALAQRGDERTAALVAAVAKARGDLDSIVRDSEIQAGSVDSLSSETARLRDAVAQLSADVRDGLLAPVAEAHSAAEAIGQSSAALRPELEWMRDAAREAGDRLEAGAAQIAGQQDRLAALLASLDEGSVSAAQALAGLSGAISETRAEAERMNAETGPALVAAMVQVREAANHAAERARSAIAAIVPQSAQSLSAATREALERTMRESVEDRLAAVQDIAAKAVESARAASERLTQQMLNLGQSAAALERHIETTDAAQRERDSEAFARRVAMLIDSMHSAAIDVGKILADEVDEKAWDAYLKGDRGIFTRRAVRLLDGAEVRAIRNHYESDGEFQQSVNRYVHDFEVMLRRVLAERDGGVIAVTLMSSDMGKLYAALAEAIDRRI